MDPSKCHPDYVKVGVLAFEEVVEAKPALPAAPTLFSGSRWIPELGVVKLWVQRQVHTLATAEKKFFVVPRKQQGTAGQNKK